ncbi:hypothetical protein EUGRSUZ_H03930 [Eucalyptus grandis]|uniref:Uncharacterized protein n=2 Tax=Eucalyptus grandis TaxID=71139 RepID=A0ACC3JVZ7_EUCGR|nr:hypothetical protein EUGRSUZ_H03930 [Eucalyptus grandis]
MIPVDIRHSSGENLHFARCPPEGVSASVSSTSPSSSSRRLGFSLISGDRKLKAGGWGLRGEFRFALALAILTQRIPLFSLNRSLSGSRSKVGLLDQRRFSLSSGSRSLSLEFDR